MFGYRRYLAMKPVSDPRFSWMPVFTGMTNKEKSLFYLHSSK